MIYSKSFFHAFHYICSSFLSFLQVRFLNEFHHRTRAGALSFLILLVCPWTDFGLWLIYPCLIQRNQRQCGTLRIDTPSVFSVVKSGSAGVVKQQHQYYFSPNQYNLPLLLHPSTEICCDQTEKEVHCYLVLFKIVLSFFMQKEKFQEKTDKESSKSLLQKEPLKCEIITEEEIVSCLFLLFAVVRFS